MESVAYLLYRAIVSLVGALPLGWNFRVGRALGTLGYWLAWPYRRLVTRNLRIAFAGEKDAAEIRRLAREHFATLGANLFCSFKVATMKPGEISARVKFENLETLFGEMRRGEGVVMVISHIGNWELFAQLAPHAPPGMKFSTVYQALGNRKIDAHVKETRARFGVVPFDRREGFNAPIRFLREGGLVGVLVDQHAGDGGLWTPLFGRLASTSPLAATLALRASASLVPVAIYSDGPARWRLVVSEPIPRPPGVSPESLTAAINQVLERQIRESPRDWFWVHDRWKTPSPKFLLAGYKRGIALPEDFSPSRLKPFRILIRSTNWLGDAVMTVPAVRAIKRGRIDAHLSVLTRAKLADFWKTVPEVDEVIPIGGNASLFPVARRIADRFDVIVLFPNSVRSALEAFLAGIPRRVGYRAKWRAALLNQTVPPRRRKPHPPEHQVYHYLQIAEHIGALTDDASSRPAAGSGTTPQTVGLSTAAAAARAAQTPLRLGLCPGAEYGAAKRWLPERFADVARLVSQQLPTCEWQLFGVGKDQEIGEKIIRAIGDGCRLHNLIGQTSLAELIERLRECRLLLTNDTGTMHLAAHLGVPTVAVFGSTEPALTGPLGAHCQVLRHHVECSPCFLRECPIDFRCMKAVTVEEVSATVMRVLRANGIREHVAAS